MAGSKQTKVAKEKPKYGNPVKSKRAAPAPAPVEESSDNEAPSDDGSELAFEDIESFIRAQSLEGTEIGKAMGAKGDAGSADDDEEDAEEVDSEEEAYLAMMAEKAQAVKEGSEESEEDDEDESDDEEEEKRRPGDGQREINNIVGCRSRLRLSAQLTMI